MKSRFAVDCTLCRGDIHVGDDIELIGRRAAHHNCAAAAQAARRATIHRQIRPDTVRFVGGDTDPGWQRRQAAQTEALQAQQARITARSDLARRILAARRNKTG